MRMVWQADMGGPTNWESLEKSKRMKSWFHLPEDRLSEGLSLGAVLLVQLLWEEKVGHDPRKKQPVKLTPFTPVDRDISNMFITATGTQFWLFYAWTCLEAPSIVFGPRRVAGVLLSKNDICPHQPETKKATKVISFCCIYLIYFKKRTTYTIPLYISCAVLETGLNGRLDQDGASWFRFHI